MIFSNVILTVNRKEDINLVHTLLIEQARHSTEEPGCKRFEVYHSQSDLSIFMLIEQWETQQHLDQHRQAKAFVEIYQPKVLPLVSRVPHPCDQIWP